MTFLVACQVQSGDSNSESPQLEARLVARLRVQIVAVLRLAADLNVFHSGPDERPDRW